MSSNRIDGLKLNLKDGWLAIRLSGTEPLLRIYAEANSRYTTEYIVDNNIHHTQSSQITLDDYDIVDEVD